ncbi:MAG TPA: RNA 2',3'-cyclic phosphodiesterase [Terriglobales bacterium]|nr:RNA 2',3'-cyclic phosphodiesterase [Terriglobales bacterium]
MTWFGRPDSDSGREPQIYRGRQSEDGRQSDREVARGRGRPFVRPQDDPPGTSRLFVAVPVADEVRAAVGKLMGQVAGGPITERGPGKPRWVRVDDLHLTLRFLGPTPDEHQAEIAAALATAAAETTPFRVVLSGGGAFPSAYAPRVLWIGIAEGSDDLTGLVRHLNRELAPLGFPADTRPFTPHLTLARTDGVAGADERARVLAEAARHLRFTWQADRIVLYKTLVGSGPVHYESLAEARLPLG